MVLFAKRSIEPTEIEPYCYLLESPLVTRLYLDELVDIQTSLGLGIIKLVVEKEKEVPALARNLLSQAKSDLPDERLQKNLLDLIQAIISYKLLRLSPQELARMFSISDLKNTRYYQEVRYEVIFNFVIDISEKDCRYVPWNVSTRVSGHAHLILGDV